MKQAFPSPLLFHLIAFPKDVFLCYDWLEMTKGILFMADRVCQEKAGLSQLTIVMQLRDGSATAPDKTCRALRGGQLRVLWFVQ